MKILIIAKRFSNIDVDNDLNIYQDGIRLKKELERQKHEVRMLFYDSNIKEYKKCYSDFCPDFIFQTGIGRGFDALKELKSLGAKLVMWYPDAYWLSQESRKPKFLKAFDVFHTKEEMLEKIKYYLEHPEIREKIAKQGQKEIFDKYTIDIVVKQYLKIIKEKLNL